MTITEILVEQCRKPQGRLGVVMTRIMNRMDAGLVEWALQKTSNVSGGILEVGCGGGETIRRLTKNTASSRSMVSIILKMPSNWRSEKIVYW